MSHHPLRHRQRRSRDLPRRSVSLVVAPARRDPGRRRRQADEVGAAEGAAAGRRATDAGARDRRRPRAIAAGYPRGLRPWRRGGARGVRRPGRPALGEQAQQLGTGHAVQQAMPGVPRRCARAGAVRRRAADHRGDSLRRLLDAPGRLAVLAAEPPDPTGYGRIVRDEPEGRVAAIVEQKDANEEQRRIRLVNTGIIAADSDRAEALAGAAVATTTRRASTT
jgi:hypothetical protein